MNEGIGLGHAVEVRTARRLVTVAAAFLLAGCTTAAAPSTVPASPSPSPAPASASASAGASSTPAPAAAGDITVGVKALDGLTSYRFHATQTAMAMTQETRGVVVNGSPARAQTDQLSNGVVAASMIQVGDKEWLSVSGSNYTAFGGSTPASAWRNPILALLESFTSDAGDVADLGHETRDGVETRHLRATAVAASPDPFGDRVGGSFVGTVDAWIALDRGYLVAAQVMGTQAGLSFAESPDPSATPSPVGLDLAVDGVDDPANNVDTPVAASPTPVASGDPEVVALINGIKPAMSKLPSWVATSTTTQAGMTMTGTVTVDNGPVQAARMVVASSAAGFAPLTILLIGKDAWSRSGSDPWRKATSTDRPTCGQGGSFSSSTPMPPCTFATLSDISVGLRNNARTFAQVSPDEVVDGVHAVHLRSVAGMAIGGLVIPGQTDVWIALDGGYLVKETFAGQGIMDTLEVGQVGDPVNDMVPPTK